ncbi:MAG: ABC transporter permease [Actinomycetota bacterium]
MTMTSAPPAPGAGSAALPAPRGRAGFAGTLRSEFTKIRSTRSTYWTLIAMIVVTVGFAVLSSLGAISHGSDAGPGFDATARSLDGLFLGQLVIAVLGALTITSEYSTGMIRTSLTAIPRRGTIFAAKATAFAVVALGAGLVASFGSFFVGQAIMSSHHINATLGQPHVLRAVIGGGLFLAACGMLAYGLGVALRYTAAGITAAIGMLFVLTILVAFLPQSWQDHVNKWTPAIAGSQIWQAHTDPTSLSAWTGFGVLCGYAAIAMIAGLILFRRRDA